MNGVGSLTHVVGNDCTPNISNFQGSSSLWFYFCIPTNRRYLIYTQRELLLRCIICFFCRFPFFLLLFFLLLFLYLFRTNILSIPIRDLSYCFLILHTSSNRTCYSSHRCNKPTYFRIILKSSPIFHT